MRGAWAFLTWAALALFMVQPMSAAAMARVADGPTIAIALCSAHGGGKIYVDQNGAPVQKKAECDRCPSCLGAPALARVYVPEAAPAAFAYEPVLFERRAARVLRAARAPPRPPSRGPPIL
jgi:hypothetical protein